MLRNIFKPKNISKPLSPAFVSVNITFLCWLVKASPNGNIL